MLILLLLLRKLAVAGAADAALRLSVLTLALMDLLTHAQRKLTSSPKARVKPFRLTLPRLQSTFRKSQSPAGRLD